MSSQITEESDFDENIGLGGKRFILIESPVKREVVVDSPQLLETSLPSKPLRRIQCSLKCHKKLKLRQALSTNPVLTPISKSYDKIKRSNSFPNSLYSTRYLRNLCKQRLVLPRIPCESSNLDFQKKLEINPNSGHHRYAPNKMANSGRGARHYTNSRIAANHANHKLYNEENAVMSAALLCRQSSDPNIRRLSLAILEAASNSKERKNSILEESKERFELQFCRINVLLVSLKIVLGLTVSSIGLCLSINHNISYFISGYWASVPLLVLGLVNLAFCLPDGHAVYSTKSLLNLRLFSGILSALCGIPCLIASLLSGNMVTKLRDFSEHPSSSCENKTGKNLTRQIRSIKDARPLDTVSIPRNNSEIICLCEPGKNGTSEFLDCKDLFQVKDLLVLQTSLMTVATLTCIWFAAFLCFSKQSRVLFATSLYNAEYSRQESILNGNHSPNQFDWFKNKTTNSNIASNQVSIEYHNQPTRNQRTFDLAPVTNHIQRDEIVEEAQFHYTKNQHYLMNQKNECTYNCKLQKQDFYSFPRTIPTITTTVVENVTLV